MNLAGLFPAFSMDRKIMDHTALSCNGRDVASREPHYQISMIDITQTENFRFKVCVFAPPSSEHPHGRCVVSKDFSDLDKLWIWALDVARLHTWARHSGVGLEKEAAA
jgi:hypothetical protein